MPDEIFIINPVEHDSLKKYRIKDIMRFCYTIMSQFWQGLGEITVKYLKSFFLMTTKTMNILEVVID